MITIRELIKHRFKFSEIDSSWNGKGGPMELRWYSDKWGEGGNEYWIELVLGRRATLKEPGVSFCWMNWDLGGGRHFVHVPCISKVQTIEGLLTMLYALGYPLIDVLADEEVETRYQKHKDIYAKYEPNPELLNH